MACLTCDQLNALRERYVADTELLRRIADEEKARAADDDRYRPRQGRPRKVPRPRGRPQTVPRLRIRHVEFAAYWLDAHRGLPVTKRGAHTGAGYSAERWTELSSLSEGRYRQRRRRLAIRLVAALAGCSERSVRAAVREEWEHSNDPDENPHWPLPPPDLEWGPEKTPEWVLGRPATVKERREAKRSRIDPGPQGG